MIRVEPLEAGYLVVDDSGLRIWRGAALTERDALNMARARAGLPPLEDAVHPMAARQFDQATGDVECLGGICSAD